MGHERWQSKNQPAGRGKWPHGMWPRRAWVRAIEEPNHVLRACITNFIAHFRWLPWPPFPILHFLLWCRLPAFRLESPPTTPPLLRSVCLPTLLSLTLHSDVLKWCWKSVRLLRHLGLVPKFSTRGVPNPLSVMLAFQSIGWSNCSSSRSSYRMFNFVLVSGSFRFRCL